MVNRVPALAPARLDLVTDCSGASAVVVGLSMTALLGFAGMAVDASVWYTDKISAQGAADAAAYSAGKDIWSGDSATGAISNARAVAAQNRFTDGVGGVTVTVNVPPTSGPNTANSSAVEVIINKPESLMFAGFYQSSASVGARAVALSGSSSGGGYCVLALDPTAATTVNTYGIDLSNGADLDLSQCGLQLNTPGSDALIVSGGAKLTAQTLSVVGNYSLSNGGKITVTGTKTVGAPAVADPYAGVATPAPGGCDHNSGSYSGNLTPGTYCGGLTISNGQNAVMAAGVYILNSGTFKVAGGSKLDAHAGVTIVLTTNGGSYATVEIDNGADVNLVAPNSGPTSGLAIMQDRNTPYGTVIVAGGAKMDVTGALYFPSMMVNFANGSTNNSTCTQLIAYRVNYAGGSKFGNNCAGVGTTAIGASATALVE